MEGYDTSHGEIARFPNVLCSKIRTGLKGKVKGPNSEILKYRGFYIDIRIP